MAEDQNQSDFDELLNIYSSDASNESESSSDFDELLDIYSKEDVKKKDSTSESPSQDGELESADVKVDKPLPPGRSNIAARVPLDMYKSIDADLIDRGDENQVAVDLEKEYGKFGFEFEPDGIGDAVRVTKNKGTKEEVTEVFDLDPAWYNLFTSEEGEAKRMKEWLEENTSQEDISTFLRDKQNRFDVDAPDPSRLQVNEAAKTEMFDEPKEEVKDFRDQQLKELDFDSIKVSPAESYMGLTQEDVTSEIGKGFKEVTKRKEDSLMAMKSAIGMEEGKVIANLTGDLDGAIVPGQEEIVAEQTRNIISEKKKASSEKRYEKGDDNYYANIALNYQELTNPNKYKRTLDEIENNDSFFERTTGGTRTKSSELVREGLNIAYTSYADERDKVMSSMNDVLKDAASLEIKIKEAEDKFISGNTFNGSQEDYDKYVADFTKLINIYSGDEFKTLNNLQKNIDATLADYEVNPDVTITEANEVIRKRYQERLDNVYKESNFLFLTGMNISQMATAGAVRGLNAIASTANNLVPDEKYDFGDIIEDSLDEFAEVIDLNVGGSSKLKRGHFERYANVYGFDVILDSKGNPTGQVYGSDGYLVKSSKADEILTAYSADPSIFESESKINVGADLYQTLPTMVDMVMTLLPAGGAFARGARALGASQKVATGVGTAAGVFIQSHDDFYDAAIEAGASESEAALFGSVQSLGVAVVSMLNPLEAKAVAATMSKASVQNLAKQYVRNIVAGKTRRDAFKLAVEATTKQSLKAQGKELVKGAVFEGLEETVGEISADQIISNTWKYLGGADVTSEVDFAEAVNTFFMAGFASLPFSLISLNAGRGTYRRQMLYGAMNNTDIVRSELEKNKGKAVTDANGVVRRIDDAYINEYVQQLEDLKSATKLYFENTSINEEDAEVIVDLVARRKALTDEMKNSALDGVSRKAYQEAISKIDDKLSLYINKESQKPFYVLEGEAISKEELDEKMSDEEWVSGLNNGRWSLSVYNDPDTENNVRKLAKAALKTEDASDDFETETKVREAKQRITDYIGQKISKFNMEQKVDPVLEKVNNSEEINENEIDGAIEALFEEIDNVRESDLSDDAKESIITELYKQAQTLENYELTTETKVISTTQRRPIKRPREVKEENTKTPQERIKGRKVVRVEGDDFAATVEVVEDTQKGKTTKPTRAKGEEVTVIEEAEDGSLLIQNYDSDGNKTTSQPLSANSMNDFELVETTKDENGIVTGAVLRNKNNDAEAFFIDDADLAMDLAIQKTQAEVAFDIEEEIFEEAIEEVEVLKSKKDDKKTSEKERVDSEKQGRQEDVGQVQEPGVSQEEGTTDTVLQEEQQVEPETEESIKQKIDDLNVKTSKEKNRAVKREALRRVAKAMASLKRRFPDIKFVVHTTQESFAKTDKDLQEKFRKSGDLVDNGYFDSETNTIHINLSTFNGNLELRTIGHEVFHAVLYNSIGIDTGRVDFSAETEIMLDAVKRSGNLSKESMDSLNKLIGQMDLKDFQINEEFLAEMVGLLSNVEENLSLTAKKAVMKWINDVAKKLGISSEIFKGVNSDAELIEMLNALSKKVAKGDVITEEDISSLGKIKKEPVSEKEKGKKFRSIKDYVPNDKQNEKIKEYIFVNGREGGQVRTVWADWFLGEDVSAKSRIAFEIDRDIELQAALKSTLYDLWKEKTGSDISYEKFLDSEITLYRGVTDRNVERGTIEENGFNTYTLDKERRGRGGQVQVKKKVKDLYGATQIVGGEIEVLEPTRYSEEFSQRLYNERSDQYARLLESDITKIVDTADKQGFYEAYKLGEELISKRKKTKKFRSIKQTDDSYVSNVKDGLFNLKPQSLPSDVWIKKIAEAGGKGTAQELEAMGLKSYLDYWMKSNNKKSVPKDVVDRYVSSEDIVDIVDVTMSEPAKEPEQLKKLRSKASELQNQLSDFWNSEEAKLLTSNIPNSKVSEYDWNLRLKIKRKYEDIKSDLRKADDAVEEYLKKEGFQAVQDREDFRKYKSYTMPDGTNYRELLITIPNWGGGGRFLSTHWDQGNIVAHIRMTDRMLNGERVLFIDEIQSDWAQEGRKYGFKNVELRKKGEEFNKDSEEYSDIDRKLNGLREAFIGSKEYYENISIIRDSGIYNWTGVEGLGADLFGDGEKVTFTRSEDVPTKETEIPFDQLPESYKNAFNNLNNSKIAKDIRKTEQRKKELEDKYGTTIDGLGNVELKKIENYDTAFSDIVNMPYEKTQQWAGLAVRRIFNLAANEGYNRVAFTRGDQIWQLVTGGAKEKLKGIEHFYNEVLPRIVRDEARRLDKNANTEIVEFKPELKGKETDAQYTPPDIKTVGKQVAIQITPKMSEKAKPGVKKFRSVAKDNTKNRKKGQSTLFSISEDSFSKESIVPIFKRGKSITTTLYEDKPISVLPIPERFLRNSPAFNNKVDTGGFMYKLGQEFDYIPGGVYVDVSDFKNKTSINGYIATSGQISIDSETGKISLSVSENQPPDITTYEDLKKTKDGSVIMTNLIKKGGGKWTWWNDFIEQQFKNVNSLVSVNTKGKHIYALSFESTTPIMLKNNASGSEPRLRPTTKGEVFLGEYIGTIRTGPGQEHAVYDRVYSVDPKDTQTLDRLNYKYRKVGFDFYKLTMYEKLGQKPPVTLASRQTNAHEFVFDKLGIKNAEYVGGGVEASVYDIGKGRIIRISNSRSNVLNKLVNKKIEGVTPVYATGVVELPKRIFGLNSQGEVLRINELDNFDERPRSLKEAPPIYYSIMQKGDPSDSSVQAKLRPIVSKLRMYIDENGIKRSEFGSSIESLIKDLSSEQLQDFINNNNWETRLNDSQKKDLDRIILIKNNLLKELGLKSRDSHLGNYVRNSKGELEAIDLGSFGTFEEGFEPQPTVEKNKLKFRRIPGGQSNTNLRAAQDLIAEESKVSKTRYAKSAVKKFVKNFGDFQFPLKRMLEKAGLEIVSSRLQNIKGAGAFAKLKFDKVRDEIFGKMTVNERYDFDRYITARRAVAANEARNKRIQDAEEGLANGKITQKEYDAIMKREQNGEPILTLGMTPEEMESDILTLENDYPKFKERADKYFDVFSKMLKDDLDNGLITQEQYDAMEGINYSPRVFLKYVFNIDGEIDGDPNWKNKLKTDHGMSEENIKKLTVGIKEIGGKNDGFIMDLMMDSEVILANYMSARARKNAMNKTTARLAKDFEGVKQRFDDLKDKKSNLASVGKELSNEEVVELESLQKIIDSFSDKKNSMKGITSELIYYVDGKRKVMYTTPEIKDMWFDNKEIGIAPNIEKWAGKTGTNILKAMATGINPLFAVTNAPRDFIQVLAFTDTYSKTRGASFMPVRMAYLLKDFFKAAYDITMKNENFENAVEDGLMMEFLYKEGRGKDKTFKTNGEKAIDLLLAGRKDYLKSKSGKLFGKLLYLNEVSEIGFRMAIRDRIMKEKMRELDAEMNKIYGSSFDKENMTDEQQEMYDQNTEDIRVFATAKARAYMDFSTGGSIIKGLDPALPYLNAAAVGAFASSKYIVENKVKFSVDALQLTAMGTALTAGGSVALLAMFRDDDDEDKELNNWQLFMREYNRIPPYITDRYHVVFTGRRDERGGYEFIKIAKNQGLSPFYSIAEGIIFNTFNTQFMKSDGYLGGNTIYSNEDIFFNANRNLWNNYNAFGFDPLELIKAKEGKELKAATVIASKVLTRNPAIGGIIELGTNYDLFRGKPINYSKDGDYLKPKYQGYRDNNLEKFWIDMSRTVGMGSGAEMKFAFEKILTSPSTNPFIATLYGFAESRSITTEFLSTKQKGGFEQVISQMSKRAFGYTNPNYNPISTKNKKKIEEIVSDYVGEEYGRREILISFSERVASQLRENKEFVDLLNDPTMSEKSKRLAEEAVIQRSVNRSPGLPEYLKELGQDEISDEEMYEIMTNVVESYNLGTMRGIHINGYKNAVKYSKSPKELASRVLVELEGMNPFDEEFKDAQEELTRVYKHIKGKGASLPKDFEKEYIKAYNHLNEELGNQ